MDKKVKKAVLYTGFIITIFTVGYNAGLYKAEISYKINLIEEKEKFQEEKDALTKQIQQHEHNNTSYATKKELEELRINKEILEEMKKDVEELKTSKDKIIISTNHD